MTAPSAHQSTSMADPHPVVEEAFKKFEILIRPSDDRMFKQTTLQQVREAAHIISRDQSRRNCLRNLNRIKPLFDILNKLSAPIDTLCQGTPYLCYIWIADEYGNSFEKLVDAYVQIAQHLPRLDRLSESYSNHADFQSILADIYSDILEFHSHAYQFLRRGGWKALFDASWRNFGSRFNAILRRLERGRDLLDREAASFEILESKDFRQTIFADLERREQEKREWQLRDTLMWLDLKGQDREQEELVERRSASREPTTCNWILRNSKVMSWMDDEESHSFLWLNGKPGSGKTTLATYLVAEAAFPPNAITLYCLCSYGFGKSESNACSLLLRSLIGQIIRSKMELIPYVYDHYVKTGAAPSIPKTRVLLRELLSANQLTYLAIDGIDECEVEHQRQILAELFAISASKAETHQIKILVCSRVTPETSRKLSKVPKLSLNEVKEIVDRDITTFTTTSLKDLYEQFDRDTVTSIRNQIVAKADGMFLWVKLVVASLLDQGSTQDMEQSISHLPADLRGVYILILDRIERNCNEKQKQRVKFVLGLLASSCRPLKTFEVCDFVVFQEGASALNDRNKLTATALSILKPFIEEVDHDLVQIVHFSAREFLFQKQSGPYLHAIDVHCDITVACVRYLLTCETLINQPVASTVYAEIIHGSHDLFPYVYEFWTIHLSKVIICRNGTSNENFEAWSLLNLLQDLANVIQKEPYTAGLMELSAQSTPNTPWKSPEKKQLRYLIPPLIQKYQAHRFKEVQFQQQTITNVDNYNESTDVDPSLLTQIHENFVLALDVIVNHKLPPEVQTILESDRVAKFRQRHYETAFLCGQAGCIWASSGFRTSGERLKHEKSHQKRFCCPYADCDDATSGFTSKQALRRHREKYHVVLADTALPPFPSASVRPLSDSQREEHSSIIEVEKSIAPNGKIAAGKSTTEVNLERRERNKVDNSLWDVPTTIQRLGIKFETWAMTMKSVNIANKLGNLRPDVDVRFELTDAERIISVALLIAAAWNTDISHHILLEAALICEQNEYKKSHSPKEYSEEILRHVANVDAPGTALNYISNFMINKRAAELAKATGKLEMGQIVARMVPQLRNNLAQKGIDPIIYHFRMLATREFRQDQERRQATTQSHKSPFDSAHRDYQFQLAKLEKQQRLRNIQAQVTGSSPSGQIIPQHEDNAVQVVLSAKDDGDHIHSAPVQVTSYWSVPEELKFPQLVSYFGRDFAAIANFLKTKSPIMIKTYYQRELSYGKHELEHFANIAEEKRAKGEDMGPPPSPVHPPKLRYEATSTMASIPRSFEKATTTDSQRSHGNTLPLGTTNSWKFPSSASQNSNVNQGAEAMPFDELFNMSGEIISPTSVSASNASDNMGNASSLPESVQDANETDFTTNTFDPTIQVNLTAAPQSLSRAIVNVQNMQTQLQDSVPSRIDVVHRIYDGLRTQEDVPNGIEISQSRSIQLWDIAFSEGTKIHEKREQLGTTAQSRVSTYKQDPVCATTEYEGLDAQSFHELYNINFQEQQREQAEVYAATHDLVNNDARDVPANERSVMNSRAHLDAFRLTERDLSFMVSPSIMNCYIRELTRRKSGPLWLGIVEAGNNETAYAARLIMHADAWNSALYASAELTPYKKQTTHPHASSPGPSQHDQATSNHVNSSPISKPSPFIHLPSLTAPPIPNDSNQPPTHLPPQASPDVLDARSELQSYVDFPDRLTDSTHHVWDDLGI